MDNSAPPSPSSPSSPLRAIERLFKQIEQQGAGLAFLAHATAFALVLAFSAGSLVALAGDAVTRFLAEWRHGVIDIPTLISFVVSFLLVVCMDVALIVAAGSVRMLRQRRQDGAGIHVAVIIGVSAVEAGTYLYMSWLYDHPATLAVWALIAARSLAAPLTAVYLSLARVLPIGARDILYQVELVTARGVIADMTQIASDPAAPPERKLALYQASSVMAPDDRQRLDALIAAAHTVSSPAENTAGLTAEQAIEQVRRDLQLRDYPPSIEASSDASMGDKPPSMGDNSRERPDHDDPPPTGPGSPHLASMPASDSESSHNVTPMRRGMGRPPRRDRRTASRANGRSGKRGTVEHRIRALLAREPQLTQDDIAQRLRVSPSSASKWMAVIEAEQGAAQTPSQTA